MSFSYSDMDQLVLQRWTDVVGLLEAHRGVQDRIEEMIRSWLSYLEHAVEQAQEAGELDPNASAREVAFQLDAFAQASNAQYQLFRDPRVFDDARRAIQERLESLRP